MQRSPVASNPATLTVGEQMTTIKLNTKKLASFSPYKLATELNAIEFRSGINWTWVTFADEQTRKQFDAQCIAHGFRVRDYGECKTQYHHYQD